MLQLSGSDLAIVLVPQKAIDFKEIGVVKKRVFEFADHAVDHILQFEVDLILKGYEEFV
jgi:hypothetical protein